VRIKIYKGVNLGELRGELSVYGNEVEEDYGDSGIIESECIIIGDGYNFNEVGVEFRGRIIICIRSSISYRELSSSIKLGSQGYYVSPISGYEIASELDRICKNNEYIKPSVLLLSNRNSRIDVQLKQLEGYEVTVCRDINLALSNSMLRDIDCIVIDYQLSREKSIGILAETVHQGSHKPILLLSDRISNVDIMKLYRHNILVLSKYITGEVLCRGIDTIMRNHREKQNRFYDVDLESGYNWSNMVVFIGNEISHHRRRGINVSVGIIEIEHHNSIIEMHGESSGIKVLGELGKVLGEQLRKGDSYCRYNSNKYVILFPGTGSSSAGNVLTRIKSNWSKIVHSSNISEFTSSIRGVCISYNSNYTEMQYIDRIFELLQKAKLSGSHKILTE
jgi:diguanylate cyclase (GGDEF)-like protein